MDDERDTTGSARGGIRLRLLDGGRDRGAAGGFGGAGAAPGTADGGWRVGPGLSGGATAANGWGAASGGSMPDASGSSSSGAWGTEAPAECVVVRNAVRASDRHEPWMLPATAALVALAADARAAGVDVELAARLTLECALVCDDLRAARVDPAALDAAAATERVGGELDAASAAYLRRLTGRRGAAAGDVLGEVVTVGLPLRLSARLLSADLDGLLAAAPLDRAIAWETAAVLSGRTMSEWAPLAALRLGG